MPHLLIALPGNETFADQLAAACGGERGRLETRRFPDGESYVRLHADVEGRIVDLVCTLARPDDQLAMLLFAADCARELGAAQVNLVAPYLAYMRQDMRFNPGEAVSSRSFAKVLSAHFDSLLTVDPHLHRYPALSALYTIPTATLPSAPLLADWIAANVERPLVVGPDAESEQWAAAIAHRIGAPCAVLRKTRHGDREVDIEQTDLRGYLDHTPVLVDDIASSGRTLLVAAQQMLGQGLRRPECVVVHALLADDAYAELQQVFARFTSTDSVRHPSNRIALAPLVAQALLDGRRDPEAT
jgi:ribose-phosphate pyrophosphokinase